MKFDLAEKSIALRKLQRALRVGNPNHENVYPRSSERKDSGHKASHTTNGDDDNVDHDDDDDDDDEMDSTGHSREMLYLAAGMCTGSPANVIDFMCASCVPAVGTCRG